MSPTRLKNLEFHALERLLMQQRPVSVRSRGGSCLGMSQPSRGVEIVPVNVDRVVGGRSVEHGGPANLLEPLLEVGVVAPGD